MPEVPCGQGKSRDDGYLKSDSLSLKGSPQPVPRKHHKKERHHHQSEELLSRKRRHKDLHKQGGSATIADDKPVKPHTIWIEESGLGLKDAYRLDARSDKSNLSYDTLYSGDLANYKRLFGDRSLGLNRDQEIKFTDSRSRGKKEKRHRPLRYHQISALDPSHSIQLKFGGKRSFEEPSCQAFLHLEVDDLEAKEDMRTPETYITQLTSDYNQQLLADPHNVSLWLEFICFQDEALVWGKMPSLLGAVGEDAQHITKKRLALLERKVAIFERALESNPLSEQLLVGHMELVQETWETEHLVKRWKDIVFKQPHRSLLWLKYITFCQSRFSFFRFSALSSLYSKCLSTLSAILNRTILSHKPEPNAEKNLVAIFLLYCYFLRQSGHSEKAIANLQALIEFNLCYPKELSSDDRPSLKESIGYFEAFWESGAALVGEEGAVGWDTWWQGKSENTQKEGRKPMGAVSPDNYCSLINLQVPYSEASEVSVKVDGESERKDDAEAQVLKDASLQEAWVRLESLREKTQSLPCRTIEGQEDMEDPERIVLFDDISKHLFFVSDLWLKEQLVLDLLRFLGAPILVPSFLPSLFPNLTQLFSTPSEILHIPPVLTREPDISSCSSSQYHLPLDPGCEMDSLPHLSPPDLVCSSHSVESLNTTIVESFQMIPSACSFGAGPVKCFVTTLFNQALSLLAKHSSLSVSVVVKSWLLYELKCLVQLECSPLTFKPALVQLQSLSIALHSYCQHRDYYFFLDLAVAIEQLLDLKKKPSQLSKVLLQPFSPGQSSAARDMFPLALCIVEYMLGLRRPPNCYSHYKPSLSLALFVLVGVAEEGFNPTLLPVTDVQLSSLRVLKARKVLQQHVTYSMQQLSASSSCGEVELGRASAAVTCLAYLEYLHSGLAAACEILEAAHVAIGSSDFASSVLAQRFHCIQARLVLHHAKTNPIRPASLRQVLERALDQFPSHPWFLQAYIECERRSYISGRLRKFFDSQTLKTDSAVSWLFAVRAEIERHQQLTQLHKVGEFLDEPVTGSLHRAQSLLTKATQSSNGRVCPALWRLFIKFEVCVSVIAKPFFHM